MSAVGVDVVTECSSVGRIGDVLMSAAVSDSECLWVIVIWTVVYPGMWSSADFDRCEALSGDREG